VSKVRILIADDHGVLRAGLRFLLNAEADMEVVGEASDGLEAVAKARQLCPDVIILDITMPGTGGLPAIRQIKKASPASKILILSMHDDESYLREALRAGASGYALKKAADTELLSAIRAVSRGEIFLDPSLTKILVTELIGNARKQREDETAKEVHRLSDRETEVLRLLAQGYTSQQVADMLFVSLKTVETYKARIMNKLGLRSRAQLVRYALQVGLLSSEIDSTNSTT
jgi:DNA-binding NarL/FixJ family response regulator